MRRGGAANLGVRGLGGCGVIRGLGGQGADATGRRRPATFWTVGGSALPRRAAAKCAAPGLPSPGVRALHVTRVGGGLPARWAETKQRRTEHEGDPRLPQGLLQRKRSREANGVRRCTVQTRLLQAGYKTGVGRSDLGNRHAPTRTGGAWPPGVKRRCLFRSPRVRESAPACSLRPRDAQVAVSRKPRPAPGPAQAHDGRRAGSGRPLAAARAPAASARGRCLSQQRGPRWAGPGGSSRRLSSRSAAGGPVSLLSRGGPGASRLRWRRGRSASCCPGRGWPPAAGSTAAPGPAGRSGRGRWLRAGEPPEGPRAAHGTRTAKRGGSWEPQLRAEGVAVAHRPHPCLPRGPVP